MVYLDYLLYIVIIILLIILINKVLNKKEGFDHKGDGFVYTPVDNVSVIKSAVYGSFIKGPKDCIDVKPILDKLIATVTDSTVVSHRNFGIDDPDSGGKKYLIINFTTPNITVSDASFKTSDVNFKMLTNNNNYGWEKYDNGFVWVEGESVNLKFGNGEGNPAWLTMLAAMYRIADLFAYMCIRMPYKFLDQMMKMGVDFIENFKNIFEPILNFYKQMKAIAMSIFWQMYYLFKGFFDQWVAIMRDIPKFLKAQLKNLINFIQDAVTKTFSLLQKLFDIVMTILNALIQLPLTLFDILEKLTDVVVNLFMIIINIPTSALNMIIGMQNIMLDVMNKTPTIPFMNLFFQ